MKLLLLLLVFLPLIVAAPADEMEKRFCSEGCQYILKTENPNAKFNMKKMMDKCKKDSKVPKIVCEAMDEIKKKEKYNFAKYAEENYTWKQICDFCK
ncbi:unnamed protein product [Cylicocyclus nassatus]|uniref:Saposin B-type domain-containing protein n=1 Tax=Cylicocyclus nassatus TaxID=53992 RepID=A0AA36DRC5_CYLNA|nr:unnamed protein product [Cylicocyclus nassatus]